MRPGTRQALIDAARRLSARLPDRWDRTAGDVGRIVLNHRGTRRLVLRHLGYGLARRSAPLVAAPFGPGRIVVDANDSMIGRAVFINGGYERWHMEAALAYLRARGRETAGTVFVDVGANIGTSTLDALLQFGFARAVCFEPAADNVRLLRANAVLNDLEDRIAVHPVAVSDHDGHGTLRRSPTNSGDHRFVPNRCGPVAGERVACRRLDTFVEQGLLDPASIGLVWVDAQGHEAQVLRGARLAIPDGVPVVVEYCPWLLGDGRSDLDAHIADRFSTVVDLRMLADGRADEAVRPPAALAELAGRYARHGYTDLLLLSE